MKLQNISQKDFVKLFGKEGLEIIKPCTGMVAIIKNGDHPELDAAGYTGTATMHDFGDGNGFIPTIFLNVERLLENDIKLFPDFPQEKVLCSYLVHEMTHIKQGEDHRMYQEGDICYWEGEVITQPASMEEYLTAPWEVEAYANQTAYLRDCSYEEALERNSRKTINFLKQA